MGDLSTDNVKRLNCVLSYHARHEMSSLFRVQKQNCEMTSGVREKRSTLVELCVISRAYGLISSTSNCDAHPWHSGRQSASETTVNVLLVLLWAIEALVKVVFDMYGERNTFVH